VFLNVLNASIIDTKIGVIIKKVHLLEHIKTRVINYESPSPSKSVFPKSSALLNSCLTVCKQWVVLLKHYLFNNLNFNRGLG
jgi:hypothetical protein